MSFMAFQAVGRGYRFFIASGVSVIILCEEDFKPFGIFGFDLKRLTQKRAGAIVRLPFEGGTIFGN